MPRKELAFSKYTGAGNDFICIDDRSLTFPCHNKELIRNLCHRQFGVGADGILLLQPSEKADFRMRILNCDGSEAAMCGNGVRCLAKFTRELGSTLLKASLETMERKLAFSLIDEEVAVAMQPPTDCRWNLTLPLSDSELTVQFLNTGVPHTVYFHSPTITIDPLNLGRAIRYHPHFQPAGTNANFASIDDKGKIYNRTYERGVEGETLACGTGVTATALAAAYLFNLSSPITVQTLSKETLTISFQREQDTFQEVIMQGPARFVFRGKIPL